MSQIRTILLVSALAATLVPFAANARRSVNPAPATDQNTMATSTVGYVSPFSLGRADEQPFRGPTTWTTAPAQYARVDGGNSTRGTN
jgi:hypothetical protein